MTDLRKKALKSLDGRIEQLRERTERLQALRNALAFEDAPTHDRFEALAKETGAYNYEDYNDRWNPIHNLWEWLDANTYVSAEAEDQGAQPC